MRKSVLFFLCTSCYLLKPYILLHGADAPVYSFLERDKLDAILHCARKKDQVSFVGMAPHRMSAPTYLPTLTPLSKVSKFKMTTKTEGWACYAWDEQQKNNKRVLSTARYLKDEIHSEVLPFHIVIRKTLKLTEEEVKTLEGLQIEAAKIAIESLASLAQINELDHLGGGLDLISALMLTLAITDYQNISYTIEHAHTSIGYYSALAALGFLKPNDVIHGFRRGIDITGHVCWVPGGTQLNGGRLGVMIPVAVGLALANRATLGEDAWVVTHCGDAGWISGQALNGFTGASLHSAPITFIMHRNGIQLSGATKAIMPKDPRPIIESLGVKILEIPSLHDMTSLFAAYKDAYSLARSGTPSLIFPTGLRTTADQIVNLHELGKLYGISQETEAFAKKHNVAMNTEIWIPGSLMSFRDVEPMLECIFLVNNLPGGEGHHDGHMKGREVSAVINNPMMQVRSDSRKVLNKLRRQTKRTVTTKVRPSPGEPNLTLPDDVIKTIDLPTIGSRVSARVGVEAGYAAIARTFPDKVFVVSCDLDVSTKLAKARQFLPPDHQFEMSIEEQASSLMANGIALSGRHPQLTIFSTFAAFFEGIAREGFEMWRYQRNLNGSNEGLNVTFHLSHVGACTGRDHFSGWGLDWITLATGYLPYLHRFYAPADARSAFVAVRDLAAHYGGHIIGVPRDNLPILEKQDGSGPLWDVNSQWEAITAYRKHPGAKKAILAFGAPAFLASDAASQLCETKDAVNVYIVNGLPLDRNQLVSLFTTYPNGIVTVEDSLIATPTLGLRGFAGFISSAAYNHKLPLHHIGITDPRIAPSNGHMEVWNHFGISTAAIIDAVKNL